MWLQRRYLKIDFFTRTGDEVGTGKTIEKRSVIVLK